MTVNLPNTRNVFMPEVPHGLEDRLLRDYLETLVREVDRMYTKLFDNDDAIRNVINTGTSGTFVDSDGNTVTVSDGLITALA